MGKTTIEWTATVNENGTVVPGYTFNPWWGCTKVSPACTNCYAETFANRYGHKIWGDKSERRFFSEKHWNQPINWHNKASRERTRFRVFCASMADVFEDRDDLVDERVRLWNVIEDTENLDWLLLTKRPENVMDMVPAHWHDFWPEWVWIGTTVENQEYADKRIPELLKIPAPVRFLSCEPLLGPVDLHAVPQPENGYFQWRGETGVIGPKDEPDDFVYACKRGIHWVICGGESGHGAREMPVGLVRSLRDQCIGADVPFFFKQWGDWVAPNQMPAETYQELMDGRGVGSELNRVRVGKKRAGRLLDGVEWNQFPTTMTANA